MSGSPTLQRRTLVVPTRSAETSLAHVLVAACDDRVREARREQLLASGLSVLMARTGFEAIVKASFYVPHLIVLDSSLGQPEIEETSRLLSTCPTTAHIPIVKVTPRRSVPRRMLQQIATAAL